MPTVRDDPNPSNRRSRLDTLAALRAIAAGRVIPAQKYAALRRAGLIRVRGNGTRAIPALSESGIVALACTPHHS